MPSKKALRNQLKQARLELTDAEYTVKSREIVDQLKTTLDWSQVKTLYYFEPLLELLEPDIRGFTTYIEDNFPNIQLFMPCLIEGDWEMVAAKGGEVPEEFDVVLVPALGFDPETKHRIGYGGGYYDKFLATQPHARKIGVCFELGKINSIPVEPHDIPLNVILTESTLYPS